MPNTRNIIIVVILLIFSIGVYTYYDSYKKVIESTQVINNELSTAIDLALEASLASDEFFGSGSTTSNNLSTAYDTHKGTFSNIVYVRGSTQRNNAMHYILNNGATVDAKNPISVTQKRAFINEMYNNDVVINGVEYKNGSSFSSFASWLGSTGKFRTNIWLLGSDDKFYEKSVTKLVLTGLPRALVSNETGNMSSYTNQTEDLQLMKTGRGGNNYFVLPTSIGVTYICPQFYEGILKSNIELQCAYNHMESSDFSHGMVDNSIVDAQRETEHTEVLDWVRDEFKANPLGDNIVNNGMYYVDLDSIECEIEYKAYNMYDYKNNRVLDEVFGAIPCFYEKNGVKTDYYLGTNTNRIDARHYDDGTGLNRASRADIMIASTNRLSDYYNTSNGEYENYVVVAKVTTMLDVMIPYRSTILQDYCENQYGSLQSVKDNGLGNFIVDTNTDSVKYVYTKYVAVTP